MQAGEGVSTACDSTQPGKSGGLLAAKTKPKNLANARQDRGFEQVKPACVLVYGHDLRLLQTRGWILECSGFKVRTTIELAGVAQILASESIRLMILCHTLSSEESEWAIANVRALRPSMKILVLTANRPLGILESYEETISPFEGPRAFLAKVETMFP